MDSTSSRLTESSVRPRCPYLTPWSGWSHALWPGPLSVGVVHLRPTTVRTYRAAPLHVQVTRLRFSGVRPEADKPCPGPAWGAAAVPTVS